MRNFKELKIWQRSYEFSLKVYKVTKQFPSSEMFGLTSQLRRCAVSIPSNIAEGTGRNTEKEFKRFLEIAISSAFECETHILIASNIGYIESNQTNELLNEIGEIQKMIYGLKHTLK